MTTELTLDRTEALILKYQLQPGNLYRGAELVNLSKNLNRELAQLLAHQALKRVWRGIYECPKQCRFGLLPPDPAKLIKAFLNSDDFLIISPNDRNSLGFGTTQLYNHQIVYNRKRCGRVELAGLVYEFRTKTGYPKKATVEFLREVFRCSDNHQEARMTTKTPRKPGSAKGQIL